MNNRHRNLALDNIAGILILHMIVIVHAAAICGCDTYALWWALMKIMCFFLPWFFFKSGMMYRPTDTRTLVKKIWKRMGIPFVFFSFLGWFIVEFIGKHLALHSMTLSELLGFTLNTFIYMGFIPGNAALWFLLSLIIVRLVYNSARKIGASNVQLLTLSVILIALAEMFVEKFVVVFPVLGGFIFYCFGSMYASKRGVNANIYKILLLLSVCFVLLTPAHSYLDFHAGKVIGDGAWLLPLFFLYSLMMIFIANRAGEKWMNHKITFITFAGQESLFLFIVHYFLLLSTVPILKTLFHAISPIALLVITTLCLFVEITVFYATFNTRHLKFLIGK
jgi:fucose 4-O-acetylase-like acetyltransferase